MNIASFAYAWQIGDILYSQMAKIGPSVSKKMFVTEIQEQGSQHMRPSRNY